MLFMFWQRKQPQNDPGIEPAAFDALRRRVEDLEHAHSQLKRETDPLIVDFEDLYDKVKRQLSKLSGREARKEQLEAVPIEQPDIGSVSDRIKDGTYSISRGEQ